MNTIEAIGYLAASASMASFVPQAWKVIKTRETQDISIGMYLLTVAAFALWLGYGAFQRQWPLVVSNGVCFALSSFILAMTLLPQAQKEKVAAPLSKKKSKKG